MSSIRKAPYAHADGSNCWTKNCRYRIVPETFIASQDKFSQEYHKETIAFHKKLDRKERNSLYYYMKQSSTSVNSYLRFGEQNSQFELMSSIKKKHEYEKYKKGVLDIVKNIDKIFTYSTKYSEPRKVFRGERVPQIMGIENTIASRFKVGEAIEIPNYVSTSVDPGMARNFVWDGSDGGYLMVITTSEGIPVSTDDYESEEEILLPRGRKFMVDKIETSYIRKQGDGRAYGGEYYAPKKSEYKTIYLTLLPEA